MKIARAETLDGTVEGKVANAAARETENATVVTDGGEYVVGDDATLLAPCEPSALYCLGKNYAETIEARDYERPAFPDFFIKPPVSVHPPNQPVPYPAFSSEVTYAGELAAVIDETARRLTPEDVPGVVRGYTIVNDLDALDQNSRTARKAFDSSAPMGPWIETDLDPTDLDMSTDVAGERRQEATTGQMLFEPSEVISFLSRRVTLQPGDVVTFGSPGNPGLVEPGDEVAIEYEAIGTLRNTVVADESR